MERYPSDCAHSHDPAAAATAAGAALASLAPAADDSSVGDAAAGSLDAGALAPVPPNPAVPPPLVAAAPPTIVVVRGGFSAVQEDFFRKDVSAKGKKLVGHILEVEEEQHPRKILIRAKCIRGTKLSSPPCKIELSFSAERVFQSGRCSCRAGIDAQCKHAAALFHFVNQERVLGCTDQEQKWQKPSGRLAQLYPKGESIQSLVSGKEDPNLTFSEQEESLQELAGQMEVLGMTSSSLFKTITARPVLGDQEREREQLALPVQKMLNLPPQVQIREGGFHMTEEEENFYQKFVAVSHEKREEIFTKTMGQAANPTWFQERKNRITASVAHKIWRARSKETRKNYFFQAPMDLPSLSYGRSAEERAKKVFQEKYSCSLYDCGLVISEEKPWLSATPDGLFEEEGKIYLLEVKSPFSCKDKEISVRYVKDGLLKSSHEYYTQIQCQLFACNLQECKLFIFSDRDNQTISVVRDDEFL